MQPWDPEKLLCKEGPVATVPVRWGGARAQMNKPSPLASLLPSKPRAPHPDLSSTQSLASLLNPPSLGSQPGSALAMWGRGWGGSCKGLYRWKWRLRSETQGIRQ